MNTLVRIARHVDQPLDEFLASKSQLHLMWTGSVHPKTLRHRVIKGVYIATRAPQPRLYGLSHPARLLFAEYHRIELVPQVHLRSICGADLCISPFHRKMLGTRFHGDPVPVPILPEGDLEQDMKELVEFLSCRPEIGQMPSFQAIVEHLMMYTPEEIRAAFAKLDWDVPQ